MKYQNKRVLVVGLARSGVAAVQLLVKHGAQVIVNDSKTREQLGDAIAPLADLPVQWQLGCPAADLIDADLDVLVISPVISKNAAFVQKAKALGVYVIAELELADQLKQGTMVAVTGTNGKTTTVSLLGEIFKNAGKTTHVVGNIGYPYSLAAKDSQEEDVFVCEVSSFQMETVDTFHPRVAALLNITEDHLNRHGTMEEYTAMKMRQFENQTEEDVAIFNDDDPAVRAQISKVKSQVMRFSRTHQVDAGAFVQDGMIVVRWQGKEENICPADEVFIPGPHNLENALAAVCMATAMGVSQQVIGHTLRTFTGVEHRIEFTRELHGVRYINDSKGTNVDSTIRAIQTMNRPTVMILGGSDKHCDFTPMVKEMLVSPYIAEAVLIGVTADQIEDTCRREGFDRIHRENSMEDAVNRAQNLAKDGWNVLLSPACASFDMFSDYEQRGRIFKELVHALK